jgi:hypothetical protein
VKNIFIYFIAISLSLSCVRELEFRIADVPNMLVVNSVMQAYEPIVVNVSSLQSIKDTTFHFIENALVTIKSENRIDTLRYISNGNYGSNLSASPNNVYHLMVAAEGYPIASASDTIPGIATIISASMQQSHTIDEEGNPHTDFTVELSKSESLNLYEVFFVVQSKDRDEMNYQVCYYSIDVELDPVILSSSYGNTYFFQNDDLTNGESKLRFKMVSAHNCGGHYSQYIIPTDGVVVAAVLRSVSSSYYRYRRSWERHSLFLNDDIETEDMLLLPFIGEPQEMYSNIENGLGVFVSYSQDYFILKNS